MPGGLPVPSGHPQTWQRPWPHFQRKTSTPLGAAFSGTEEKQVIPEELVEVDLGEFTVTAYQPVSATTLRIDFHLFGTVVTKDAKDFTWRWRRTSTVSATR